MNMNSETTNEFTHNNVTVRIHGNQPNREALERACIKFMQAIEAAKAENAAAGDNEGAA